MHKMHCIAEQRVEVLFYFKHIWQSPMTKNVSSMLKMYHYVSSFCTPYMATQPAMPDNRYTVCCMHTQLS